MRDAWDVVHDCLAKVFLEKLLQFAGVWVKMRSCPAGVTRNGSVLL